jgi:hypothetical protein
MRHEQFLENLSAYVEGSLDPAKTAAMDHYVRSSADAYREVAALRDLYEALDSPMMEVEPPPTFHADVMRRIRVQQREVSRGFVGSLTWAWSAAAGAAAALLVWVVVSGTHQAPGVTAGFHSPRWAQEAVQVQPAEAPALVIGGAGPAIAGGDYPLSLDFVAPASGTWRMTVRTSAGIDLSNMPDVSPTGVYRVWEGELDQGARSGLALVVQPTRTGVHQIAVRFHNVDTGYDVHRVVFLPVQTGGTPSATLDWYVPAGSLGQAAFEDVAREYGTPVIVPAESLSRPVSLRTEGTNAGRAIVRLSDTLGLRWTVYNGAYNLF